MFEAAGAYIKNIALIMLLAILAEMALPEAKIKKYVSVVIGIVMIFAVGGRIFSLLGLMEDAEITIPVFSMDETSLEATEDYDIRERLTGILYDQMNSQMNGWEDEVDDNSVNNDGLGIKVERVSLYK